MRSVVLVLLLGCDLSRTLGGAATTEPDGDATPDGCETSSTWWNSQWAQRFAITGAPAGYTARVEIPAGSLANTDDVRIVVDDTTELDRAIDGAFVEFRAPPSGQVALYIGNASAGMPPANPAAIYSWFEAFDAMAVNSNGAPKFTPQTTAWRVVDDNGNRIYRVAGGGRHPAPIASVASGDVEIRARMRIGAGGGSNHNGLLVRAANIVPDNIDGYVGQLLENNDYSRIAEYQNGASFPPELGTHTRPVARATWYALRMKALGNRLELYVDGTLEVASTMGAANGTTFGLYAFDADVDYDDVRVRLLVNPEPAIALGAREDVPCN
jgi:hypothetical protein